MTRTLEELAGTALLEGTFAIDAEENRRLATAIGGAAPADGLAHPVYAYAAAQRGIGVSVAQLLAMADFDVADGPLLGSCDLRWEAPLRVGVDYRVSGEIVSVVRKHGRSGSFDLLTVRERLSEPGGAPAATVTNVFVLPRPEERS